MKAKNNLATSSSDIAISIRGLSKNYRLFNHPGDRIKQFFSLGIKQYHHEFTALKDVSFDIKKDETVGIIGRNGSGKSTLLQLICGILKPTAGSITVSGRVSALLELGAGFNPEFTGRENVYFQGALQGFTPTQIDARFDEIAAFADIGEFIDQPVRTYSSGMFVRLAFSVAISVNPEILIIDEALSVGDTAFQARCLKRINQLRQFGATVIFVSHDVTAVRSLCEQAIWLENGQVKMIGDVLPVTGRYMQTSFEHHPPKINEASRSIGLDNPIMHWGSHLGILRSVGVYGKYGIRKDAIFWNEEIEIRLVLSLPMSINIKSTYASFSIKDFKGTDLITSSISVPETVSTQDDDTEYSVVFRFRNPLVAGDYLLAAAIEDHSLSPSIKYYEYLEGGHYFSSQSTERFIGIFQPAIEKSFDKVSLEQESV